MLRRILLAALLLAPIEAQAQLAVIAPTVTSPTDNSDRIATTAWVNSFVNAGLPLANGKIWIGSVGGIATAQTPSGDLTVSNAGAFTLATVNANVGNFGSATQCAALTTNAKGLITAASATTCTPAIGSITGLGTGAATALGVNIGTSGAFVVNGGALGTPSSGVGTNLTSLNATNISSGVLSNARLNATITPQGRLTLTTGTPVMTSNVSAATSVLYTPDTGNLVPIFDGTNMVPTAFTQLSNVNANSSTGSAGPATVAASSCYDYFVWSSSGTPTLTRGPAWTNTTTRSAGTALTQVNGLLLNNASITNGPAAQRGTYVGTACSNSGANFDWSLGGSASGGSAALLMVWNMYNRVEVAGIVTDSGASYTYTAAAVRQARASAGNQITFVMGLAEDAITAQYTARIQTASAASATGLWGIGLDTTSSFSCIPSLGTAPTSIAVTAANSNVCPIAPQTGLHVVSGSEQGDGGNANTFDQTSANILSANLRM